MKSTERQWLDQGNLHRQRGEWKQAIECYNHAISLNPQSEALHARDMVMDILDFGNTQIYNV